MNVIGLNDLSLRSLTGSYAWSSLTAGARVYLFKGEMPASLDQLPFITEGGTRDLASASIAEHCHGVAGAILTLNRDVPNNKIQLILNTANPTFHRSFNGSFKADPALVIGATPIGDCFLHNINTYTSTTSKSWGPLIPEAPALDRKALFSSTESLWGKSQLSWTDNTGSALVFYLGARGDSGPSTSACIVATFDKAVWADFITYSYYATGNASSTRTIAYLQVLTESDVWETVASGYNISPNRYRHNFSRRKIKAIRMSTGYNTTGFVYGQYWANRFTAGIANYQDLPEFTTDLVSEADPYTWAIIQPETDTVDRAANTRKPIILASVGNAQSSADLKMTDPTSHLFDANTFLANQLLMELSL